MSNMTVILPPVFWILWLHGSFLYGKEVDDLLLITIFFTLAAILVLIWRVRQIHFLYDHGLEVKGVIIEISYYKNRGKITYEFVLSGENFTGSSPVIKNKRTKMFDVGEQVVLYVDEDHPKRVYMRDLFVAEY